MPETGLRVAQPLIVGRRGIAGKAVIAGRVVVLHLVVQATNESDFIHDPRDVRQSVRRPECRERGWRLA